jgi:hypothetical protein
MYARQDDRQQVVKWQREAAMLKRLGQMLGLVKKDEVLAKRFQQIRKRSGGKTTGAYTISPITSVRCESKNDVVGKTTGEWELAWRREMLDRLAERNPLEEPHVAPPTPAQSTPQTPVV